MSHLNNNLNFTVIRNPVDLYVSLYNFLRFDPKVNNNMRHIARKFDLDTFI